MAPGSDVASRAALITGGSRGIGFAIADMLGAEGYALTLTARKPDGLERAVHELTAKGYTVHAVPANLNDEDGIKAVVAAHHERYGRLDVLVNNGGVGIGGGAGEQLTKFIDLQLDVNVRAVALFYRECLEMLTAAGAEHRKALVVNLASMAAKHPLASFSVYSATKAAVVSLTVAMNEELAPRGIKSVALCPGWVNTGMTEFMRESVPPEDMLNPEDISSAVKFLLGLSPAAVIPEIAFERPGARF
jgi:NAD(P)-dependent dehydrogenase (short-subunit alcohol dehydrogenase family)